MSKRPKYWIDSGTTLDELRRYFKLGKYTVRIMTGFFSMTGYDLVRASLKNKKVKILVGVVEPAKERVRKKLINEIKKDLRTGDAETRYDAVLDVVTRIQNNALDIIDARAKGHHAKVYIIDDKYAIFGSSNTSMRGLKTQVESGTPLRGQIVKEIVDDFERHFNDELCINITQELLETLLRWLEMASPWEIYLKTMKLLRQLDELDKPRPDYRMPVNYQNDVIAEALLKLEEHKGCIIVASTGLGKTVIGADIVRRRVKEGLTNNVIIFSPAPVREEWDRRIKSAGVGRPTTYTISVLNVIDQNYDSNLADLLYDLDHLTDKDLIIIDESHQLSNRFVKDKTTYKRKEATAYQRLLPAIKDSGCSVLLLTASPYSTELDDINNQLYLLPHTAPSEKLPGFDDEPIPWKIRSVNELKNSEVSVVISTPYVAKFYTEDDGSIDFNGNKRYLPSVSMNTIDAPFFMLSDVAHILNSGILDTDVTPPFNKGMVTHARVAWRSSPIALTDFLTKTANTPDYILSNKREDREQEKLNQLKSLGIDRQDVHLAVFKHTKDVRAEKLAPLLDKLNCFDPISDRKLQIVLLLLDKAYKNKQQVVIYCERIKTVAYLEENIERFLPHIRVFGTVFWAGGRIKKSSTIDNAIKEFARVSNGLKPLSFDELKYQVFISTDSYLSLESKDR